MPNSNEFRLAGISALLAIPALLISGIFWALFPDDAGDVYGSLNDFFVALTMVLLVLPALAVLKVLDGTGLRSVDTSRLHQRRCLKGVSVPRPQGPPVER